MTIPLRRDPNTVLAWQHYVYGKLVQSVNGPIVHGSEHGCTGHSESFPKALEADCHPSKVGLGVRDAGKWAQCAWGKIGGVASAVSFNDDEPWVMCVRQRERSEAGEGVEGRLYAEAHYAVLPARLAQFDSIRNLAEQLQAEPRLAFDAQLPVIEIPPSVAQPLPDGWFDQIAPIVRAVMSGVVYSLQDWEKLPSQFLASATRCLAAVPGTLRWRLSVGAGMMTLENTTAFGYGMVAIGGLRVISGIPRNANEFSFADGDNYLKWLRPLAQRCQTERELAEVVDRELSRYAAFDAIDVRLSWNETARIVTGALQENEALVQAEASVDRGDRPVGADRLMVNRYAYLEMLYARVGERLSARLPVPADRSPGSAALQSLDEAAQFDWNDSWQQFVAASSDGRARVLRHALSMLLGAVPVTRPADLTSVRHVDLPGSMQERAVATLANAFENTPDAKLHDWVPMLGIPGADDATWVSRWRADVGSRAAWLGLREVVANTNQSSAVLNALRDTPIVKAAMALLDGSAAKASDSLALAQLFAAAEPDDLPTLDALIDLVIIRNPIRAFQLAQQAVDHQLRPRLDRLFSGQALASAEREYVETTSKQLAKALLQSDDEDPSALMMRALMHQRAVIGKSARGERLRALLAQRIGDPFATVLLGLPAVGFVGPDHKLADAMIPHASIDAEVIEQLIKQWTAFGGAVEVQVVAIVRRWLDDEKAIAGSRYPLAVAVRTLAGQPPKHRPKLTAADRAMVRAVLVALRLPFAEMWKHAPDETFADVVADLAPPHTVPGFLNGDQLASVLGASLDDDRVRTVWRTRIAARNWEREPGWRIINGSNAGPLSEVEMAAMLEMQSGELLQLFVEGVALSKTLVGRLKRSDLVEVLGAPSPRARDSLPADTRIRLLTRLLELATADANHGLIRDVGVVALGIVAHDGQRKTDVLAALGGDAGLFDRMLRTVRKPASAIELVRSVITALRVTPAQFLGQHWEAARKR